MRSRREATSDTERAAAAASLDRRLGAFAPLEDAARIAGYVAVRGEPALDPLASRCHRRGQAWLLPVLDEDGSSLRFARWRPDGTMAANRFGIPEPVVSASDCVEPTELDAVLVPLLAFDRDGHRLGTGGGYYDRTFAFLAGRKRPTRPLLIGIGWSFQETPLEAEPWDIPVDWVATERELIRCHA